MNLLTTARRTFAAGLLELENGTMTAATKRPTIGDECWEVEWCSEMAFDEFGDHDCDMDKYAFKYFSTESKAVAYAHKIFPQAKGGQVSVTPMRFVPYDENDADTMPHVGFWEHTADSEWITDERENP